MSADPLSTVSRSVRQYAEAPAAFNPRVSRPILERLGLSEVAEITQLYDPATL